MFRPYSLEYFLADLIFLASIETRLSKMLTWLERITCYFTAATAQLDLSGKFIKNFPTGAINVS